MDECGEKEARKGLTVANKRHDPKIKDWTGPGSVELASKPQFQIAVHLT